MRLVVGRLVFCMSRIVLNPDVAGFESAKFIPLAGCGCPFTVFCTGMVCGNREASILAGKTGQNLVFVMAIGISFNRIKPGQQIDCINCIDAL